MTEKGPHEQPRRGRGRPPKIDPAHILKVAREVFIARGFSATTAEVAQRAGVSEGSVFHLFKSKEQLFRQAMQMSMADVPALMLDVVKGMKSDDLEAGLTHLADRLVEVARIGLPLMMMSWSNPNECGASLRENSDKFRMFIKTLAGYFEAHIAAGRLRPVDSEVLARVFLGAMHHYCMSRIFADEFGIELLPEDMFKRGLIDLVLNGARPPSPTPIANSPYSRRLG